jgi:hypothetical protein
MSNWIALNYLVLLLPPEFCVLTVRKSKLYVVHIYQLSDFKTLLCGTLYDVPLENQLSFSQCFFSFFRLLTYVLSYQKQISMSLTYRRKSYSIIISPLKMCVTVEHGVYHLPYKKYVLTSSRIHI